MATKYKLTRPELKRFRDQLTRFERYLPMLKLKQQQLQMAMREVNEARREAHNELLSAQERFDPYRDILRDVAGVNITELSHPQEVRTGRRNIAGVDIPVYEDCVFPSARYSLFATPPWVDQALQDMRNVSRARHRVHVIDEQYRLLQDELTKISQRVNLFEKVKIPECKEAIRRIRIQLGDEMTAAVGRAKIAKAKISEKSNAEEFELK